MTFSNQHFSDLDHLNHAHRQSDFERVAKQNQLAQIAQQTQRVSPNNRLRMMSLITGLAILLGASA